MNTEAFELIEQRKEEGVTADYLASKLGIDPRSAASWLSKWAKRGFLKYIPYNGGGVATLDELERLERLGKLSSPEDQNRLKTLRAWKLRGNEEKKKRGKPACFQGKYVLGSKEWGSYAHGKLEERIALRESTKKW